MTDFVLKDAYVSINAVDLSDHVRQVSWTYNAELQDNTAMGDTTRSRLAGLLDCPLTIEFYEDHATSKVQQTLFPLVGAAAFAVAVRASKASAISATNPEYQKNMVLESYPLVSGSVGDMAMAAVTLQSGDGLAVVRDVTP